ncbi:MAG: glycoside hydrolase family 2 [Bacteroidales bacterium]|nr:glycoside hydrolase family 2 [Bacteroidales bacterium]
MKKYLILSFAVFLFYSCSRPVVEIPLQEHPRPDFEREAWLNLNGYWNFAPDSAGKGESESWFSKPEIFDMKILVPFSWASPKSGIEMPGVHTGWYYRDFVIDNDRLWKGKDIYLLIGASDFHTRVWVNGHFTGEHKGGYVPFEFNITDALKKGKNKLVIMVEDHELDNRPSGKQYYGNAKGIWQTVYLEAREDLYISGIFFTPNIDAAKVNIRLELSAPAPSGTVFRLTGHWNVLSFESPIPEGAKEAEFSIEIPDMKLWSVEDPYLYEVTASLTSQQSSDAVKTYFGMRKISAVPIPGKDFTYVALNNKPLYLKLTLDQSYHPEGFYTFPSDQFMKEEIMRAKALGLNGLRIHIKAEIPRKLYWADKLGLLIMEDVPNYWGEPTPGAKANWEYIAENEIKRDYNHPSIFSWVLFNETWGLFTKDPVSGRSVYTRETQEWVRSWYRKTKEFDKTRLVEDNSPCNLDHVETDLNTWHSYNPARQWKDVMDEYVKNTFPGSKYNFIGGNVQGNQPMLNSECGAVWGYDGSTGDIDLTWEYHIMMNEFRKRPKIAGFLFTEFHDVINEWNGYYRFDRKHKDFGLDELSPGMTMKDFQGDLYVVAGDDFFRSFSGGESAVIPLGISAVTSDIPADLKIEYTVFGWDQTGTRFEWEKGAVEASAEPFSFIPLQPVRIKLPDKTAVMSFATTLKDGKGNILQRNFVPFRVKSKKQQDNLMIAVSPSSFSNASWGIKHLTPQEGRKAWGMGTGFFEYEFNLPSELSTENIDSITFLAELAARYPQEKYLDEGDAESIGMTVVSTKGIIPGYGKNSYPQTDEKFFPSTVVISVNGQETATEVLPDDPADHRGILSWVTQKPGWEWGSKNRDNKWLLDEAGSYGYLVRIKAGPEAIRKAADAHKVIVRLEVKNADANRGGLSVYGSESGRFPFDPSIIVSLK